MAAEDYPLSEYKTIEEALEHPDVTYNPVYLYKLCREGTILSVYKGPPRRGVYLLHMPSLLAYIERMNRLGNKKYGLRKDKKPN